MSAGEARIDLRDAALFDRPTQSVSPVDDADGDGASAIGQLALADGEVLGHYRVLRCLGRGGMGEVFDAVDLRSGTRVAIKTSRRPLDGEADRARFLREGRLAAAVSHPNVVYVLAVDECRGLPIIVTELVTGGTLRDLVERHGRLAAMEAVDLMRQVVAGLDAAARAGVVHRDVKPSNCFIDAGGEVKIGDFGLAISTLEGAARPRAAAIEGTLAFASPEQLRGEPPDVRSDVYSAGATLYYLLTGRPPFAGADGTRLIAHALRDPTPRVRRARPDVARGLDRVVRRCLAKDPAERPPSHADLSRLLLPFGSMSSTPATLGFRALAGLVDVVVLRASLAVSLLAALQWTQNVPATVAVMALAHVAVILAYFGVCETVWGASPGKRIFGLRVVTTTLRPVDGTRAFIRAGLWTLSLLPGGLVWLVLGPPTLSATMSRAGLSLYLVAYGVSLLGFVVLFSTARTRNAFAGLHEVLTGTRVVSRLVFESGHVRPHPLAAPIVPATAPGPAHYVLLDEAAPPGVVVGYDDMLARRVWIRHGTPGTPPVPLARRQVSRPSRLHWLAGGRDDGTAWDVYEMAPGEALRGTCRQPRSWPVVRGWLFDLADEMVAAGEDGTGVPLTPGRVWVTDARATLLDWDVDPGGGAPPSSTVARFLVDVATIGLGHGAAPVDGTPPPQALPLHAQAFLAELAGGRVGTADETVERLRALSTRRATVTRARRGLHLMACVAAPLFSVAAFLGLLALLTLVARSPDAAAEQARALASSDRFGWQSMLRVALGVVAASALAGLVSSLVVPGGVAFRLLDLAVVGPDGRAVTRTRGISRAAIAWILPLASVGLFVALPASGAFAVEPAWLPSLVLLALFVGGGLVALIDPRRGLQDRIAGTSLVPR